jgi:beta-lactamase superfamily II metal-dependent hydrolase
VPQRSGTWRRLQRWKTDLIDRLILTHNDADHARGLHHLLAGYHGHIQELWLLIDSALGPDDTGQARRKLFSTVRKEHQDRRIRDVRFLRAARCDSLNVLAEGDVRLRLLYPQPIDNLNALLTGDPNITCAVLELSCGPHRILFGADAPLPVWLEVARRHGRLDCDILVVPHHGGHIHLKAAARPTASRFSELVELYQTTICCKFAIISVGTVRNHGHPFPEHVEAIRQSGARLLCTQITSRCHPSPSALPATLLPAGSDPSSPSPRGDSARACGGTVRIDLTTDQALAPAQAADHTRAVDDLHRRLTASSLPVTQKPMCRERTSSLPMLPAVPGR